MWRVSRLLDDRELKKSRDQKRLGMAEAEKESRELSQDLGFKSAKV